MKYFIHNEFNLDEKDIDEEVVRVKALLINSNDELLMGYSYKVYQFPGGHVENGEDMLIALQREIKEETGISLKLQNIIPFACNISYFKDYRNTGKNRKNYIYYYEIKNDLNPNLSETNYTKDEVAGEFELRYIKVDDIEDVINENVKVYENPMGIATEMLELLKFYKQYRGENYEKTKRNN